MGIQKYELLEGANTFWRASYNQTIVTSSLLSGILSIKQLAKCLLSRISKSLKREPDNNQTRSFNSDTIEIARQYAAYPNELRWDSTSIFHLMTFCFISDMMKGSKIDN